MDYIIDSAEKMSPSSTPLTSQIELFEGSTDEKTKTAHSSR